MKKKYIKVEWPESQVFEDHPRAKECYQGYNANPYEDMVIFVPEDLYDEVISSNHGINEN